jgi:rRNA maturation protein Nop10
MASQIKVCPHCRGYYERKMNGCCPHCGKKVGIRAPRDRTCPACKYKFKFAVLDGKKRHCPNCGIELYYPQGKLAGQTLLMADKEAVNEILALLEKHISRRDAVNFTFSDSEKRRELFHGYQLVSSASSFIVKQKQQIPPYVLARLAVEEGLANGLAGAMSLAQFRGSAGRLLANAYRKEQARLNVNQMAAASIDYEAFRR